jgi:hypothetical protein
MPLAIAIAPWRTASLPVAHAFSRRETGMSRRPHESARIPVAKPVGRDELAEPSGLDVGSVEPLVDRVDGLGHRHRDDVLDAELEQLAEVGHAGADQCDSSHHAAPFCSALRTVGQESVAVVGDALADRHQAEHERAGVTDGDRAPVSPR